MNLRLNDNALLSYCRCTTLHQSYDTTLAGEAIGLPTHAAPANRGVSPRMHARDRMRSPTRHFHAGAYGNSGLRRCHRVNTKKMQTAIFQRISGLDVVS